MGSFSFPRSGYLLFAPWLLRMLFINCPPPPYGLEKVGPYRPCPNNTPCSLGFVCLFWSTHPHYGVCIIPCCLLTASTQYILACPAWRLHSNLTLVLPGSYLGVGKPLAASAASTLATTARCSIVEILLLAGLTNLCAIVSLSNDLITIIPLHTYLIWE